MEQEGVDKRAARFAHVRSIRTRHVHQHFNELQLALGRLGMEDLASQVDALHHDFYTATTEGEGE